MASFVASIPGGGGRHALSAASHSTIGKRRGRVGGTGSESQLGIEQTTTTSNSSRSSGSSVPRTSSFTSSNTSSHSLNSTYSRILSQTIPNINSEKKSIKNIRCGGGRIGGRGMRRNAQSDRGGLESDEQEQDFPCFRKRKVVDKDRIDQDQSENVQQVVPQWIQLLVNNPKRKRQRTTEIERSSIGSNFPLMSLESHDDIRRPERLALPYHTSSQGFNGMERFEIGGNAKGREIGGNLIEITRMDQSPHTLSIPYSESYNVRTSSIYLPPPPPPSPPPPNTQHQTRPDVSILQPRPYHFPPSPFIQHLRSRSQTPHLNDCPSLPFSTPGRPKSRISSSIISHSLNNPINSSSRPYHINHSSHPQVSSIAQNLINHLETINEEEDGIARTSSEMSYMSLGDRGMMDMTLNHENGSSEGGKEDWSDVAGQMEEHETYPPFYNQDHRPSSAENFWTSPYQRQGLVQSTYNPSFNRSLNIDLLESAAQAQAQNQILSNSQEVGRSCSSLSLSTQSSGRGRWTMDGSRMIQMEVDGEQEDTQSQRTRSSHRKPFRAPIQTFCPTPPHVLGVPDTGRLHLSPNDMDVDSIRSFDEKVEAMTIDIPHTIKHVNISDAAASEAISNSISEVGSLSEDGTRVASSDHDTKMEDAQKVKIEVVVGHDVGFDIWQDE